MSSRRPSRPREGGRVIPGTRRTRGSAEPLGGASLLEVAADNSLSLVAELVRFLHEHLDRISWNGEPFGWEGRRRLL